LTFYEDVRSIYGDRVANAGRSLLEGGEAGYRG
jgi:hypothetical protein